MKKTVGLISLGCPKNLVDSEIMLGQLKNNGFNITNDATTAEIIIINTCGFIESAKQESINTILEMAEYKKDSCKLLIVTGCLAQRYKTEILKEIPEVDVILGTNNINQIIEAIEKANSKEKIEIFSEFFIDNQENKRLLSTAMYGYAYLKIAEGCDNCCTYCIIPKLRGKYKSKTMQEIVDEAKYLASQNIKELILVAQDVTRYGIDIYKKKALVELIKSLSNIDGIQWVRLLYCYPEEIDDDLIQEIRTNKKVCKYIDIPIQHISDKVLKMMGRRGNKSSICKLIEKLRVNIPDIHIRSTFIVGFPGETEMDFSELYEFTQKYKLDNLGVFMYSKEEETAAYELKPQIKKSIKLERYSKIMQLQNKIVVQNNEKHLNRVYKTLVEGVADDGIFYFGRNYMKAPEIDGLVYFTSEEPLQIGTLVNVKILNTEEYDLIGVCINEN